MDNAKYPLTGPIGFRRISCSQLLLTDVSAAFWSGPFRPVLTHHQEGSLLNRIGIGSSRGFLPVALPSQCTGFDPRTSHDGGSVIRDVSLTRYISPPLFPSRQPEPGASSTSSASSFRMVFHFPAVKPTSFRKLGPEACKARSGS